MIVQLGLVVFVGCGVLAYGLSLGEAVACVAGRGGRVCRADRIAAVIAAVFGPITAPLLLWYSWYRFGRPRIAFLNF